MIRIMRYCLLALGILLSMALPAAADFGLEFNFSQNFTENLLLDSTKIGDSYSSSAAAFSFYPIPQTEIRLTSEYTYYSELIGLGNILNGVGLSFIPLHEESPFIIYLNGTFNKRSYRDAFNGYNTNDVNVMGSMGLSLAEGAQLRTGLSYKNTAYVNTEEADKEIYGLFWGGNFTVFGSNSLDIESGLAFAKFKSIDTATIYTFPQRLEEINGNLKSFYIAPRFSRPLGKKNGISIMFYYSTFVNFANPLVYSYSTGFLSPWASVWEGNSISVNLKSYIIPKVVLTAGAGYWNKSFLNSLQLPDLILDREDDLSRYYLNLSWPIPSRSGIFVEPSLRIDYSNNTSSLKLYDYSNFSAMVGMRVSM